MAGTLLLSVALLRFGHVWFSPIPALLVLALGASLWIYRLLRQTHKQAFHALGNLFDQGWIRHRGALGSG